VVAVSTVTQVKGAAFHSVMVAVKELHGAEVEARARAQMQGDVGEAIRLGALLTSGWYPVEWYRTFYAAVVAAIGKGPGAVHEVGRRSARHDVTGIYRVVFKLLSVHTVFGMATRAARLYFDRGEVTVNNRENGAEVRYEGFDGFDANIWSDMRGGGEMVLELAGGKDIKWRITSGGGDGDSHMHVELTWS
jgi:hypothetical protein